MSLQLNVSNSLYQLVDELAISLRKPLPTVFHPHYVVTQTDGMNNWLKVEIAARLGITANIQFLKPNDLITNIYYILGGPHDQVLSTHNLQWVIYEVLDESHFKNKFRHISEYYINSDVKRIAMAEKVADLFDQYQIYRPEMIEDWNEIGDIGERETNWQRYLWRSCLEKVGDKMPDKTRIGKFILTALDDLQNRERIKERIPLISFFGISIITSYHLQIFHALAQHIDVSFNLINPAPDIYWFEDRSAKYIAKWRIKDRLQPQLYEAPLEGNPLLTNWGKVIQDTFSLFLEDDILFNHYLDNGLEPQPVKLLGKLQNDIYHNSTQDHRNKLEINDLLDESISINSCYTPIREVEVLYNYLTHLVDTNPNQYSPRDIVVMVTDIDLYGPYIKAIFNSAPYQFPFTIADERLDRGNSLFGAINAFLELDVNALHAEDVLQLLDWDYIKNRFQLRDINLIRRAVDLANIRLGIKGDLENDTVHVSWLNGLNRIMYGICMYSEDEYCLNGNCFFPVDLAEGESAEELIRFTHFVNVLIDSLTQQRKKRNLTDWGDYIINIVNNLMYLPEEDESQDYQVLLQYVERLNLVALDTHETISYTVFKHNLINVISGESRSDNFASGGITFCSLIPMRSIPFKVVALLGMNAGQFPRNEVKNGFNLIQQKPKKGDRDIKGNDKHLFLETILSAQEHLFISFIGRNVKDNTVLPPSILVDELIDYITSGVLDENEEAVRNALIINHPLHNFSTQPARIVNYIASENNAYRRKDSIIGHTANNIERIEFSEVTVREFISFFKDPFKCYYNRILNINYQENDILLRESEWFELDSLGQWDVKNDLLTIDDDQLSDYIQTGIRKGYLPLKNYAIYTINEIVEKVRPSKEKLNQLTAGYNADFISIQLDVNGVMINGQIENIYGDKIISVSFSKNKHPYLLDVYINYLLAKASGVSLDGILIDSEDNEVFRFPKDAIDETEAFDKLASLLELYQTGHQNLLIFHPRFENDPVKVAKLNHQNFQKNIEELSQYNSYIQREHLDGLFEKESIYEQYLETTDKVFSDIYSILRQ
ncbi:exodeoxyribonuclease V subunit gamma [Albibacterium profundi]|uniref:RecBCD enzyme subunit RecC n=1 Tax=Albibacterium profundi TaxID=3134906 RepID=A0ABV5CHI3_9SPHI